MKMTSRDITPDFLRMLLHYDPETGKLFWKERSAELMPNERIRNAWNSRCAGKEAGSLSCGYFRLAIFGCDLWCHRVAWAVYYGSFPKLMIDHINGNGKDNRICNMREANHSQNGANSGMFKHNTTGIRGVRMNKRDNRWFAEIRVNNKQIYLGGFDDVDDAITARKAAEKKYFGEFA